MTDHATPQAVYLKDYRPSAFLISTIKIFFNLREDGVTVKSCLQIKRNNEVDQPDVPLVLDGIGLELVEVALDGRALDSNDYILTSESLSIAGLPEACTLEITTRIYPDRNTALEGLYRSSANYCTQCEAQGFRKITYFIDRPDVLATYTVTIEANRDSCPVLLANGNLVETGTLPDNRHFARYHDPFPKPSYLFALVAGKLTRIEDFFTTASGRRISLQIYVEKHNRDKCDHAMISLKHAMRWDEETFGLEYDLDQYMIVAVDDFNMGAMENKGLNVFNSKYVLARPETATDDDYEGIEAVVAHEYFHNWTGNRVTCRDWFQLSLKEGLTVFRDQLFSGDMSSPSVRRISDVTMLRNRQFPEDGGPMAHAVRPDSYIEINNFYTMTIYEKGAEIIRMLYTLLGRDIFRQGLRLYLAQHDGTGATTEDFVRAMEEAGGLDLTQFRLWYTQAGTPVVRVGGEYLENEKKFRLTFAQSCPPTPGQAKKEPLHIPVALGLLNPDGSELDAAAACLDPDLRGGIFHLKEARRTLDFSGVALRPIPSLLRGFSAPVKLEYDFSAAELGFLLAHDQDLFNRWEAGQRLAVKLLLGVIGRIKEGLAPAIDPSFCRAMAGILTADPTLTDKSLVTQLLTLPSEEYLGEQMATIDVDAIHAGREFVRRSLAQDLREQFWSAHQGNLTPDPYCYDPMLAGKRRLKNLCLSYLILLEEPEIISVVSEQFKRADNMTDEISALRVLVHSGTVGNDVALNSFYEKWRHDPLVMDKWLSLQATVPNPDALLRVKELEGNEVFSLKNPNKVRALIGAFSQANPVAFHAADGSGYTYLTDRVLELDRINPQIAARLLAGLSKWRRFEAGRQGLMCEALQRIKSEKKLSSDVFEVVSRTLADEARRG